ncbi:MAG TPA: hypothetical protein VFN35_07735 [Ktedonobacteraceae bacterium]|nr:hypothetical protein [Ktedonobacteraceae bacterium]
MSEDTKETGTQENASSKTPRQPKPGSDLAARIREQQNAPGSPLTNAAVTYPGGSTATPALPSSEQPTRPAPAAEKREKSTVRATHFVDDDGVEWVRTGLTLPNAFLKGIIAYVNQRRLEWSVGDPRVTQQDVQVEAIGIWLNDHRSELPTNINQMCDDVRAKLRRS